MKLQNLTIENFRSFDLYAVNNLGRVNLLVGTNNSGKTSILEAALILMSSRPLSSIWTLLHRRGEVSLSPDRAAANVPTDLIGDVRHLFKDHALAEGEFFQLRGGSVANSLEMRVQVVLEGLEAEGAGQHDSSLSTSSAPGSSAPLASLAARLVVTITPVFDLENRRKSDVQIAKLDDQGGLSTAVIDRAPIFSKNHQVNIAPSFVALTSMDSREITRSYNDIILTDEENLVMEAVQLIDRKIQRIAPIANRMNWPGPPSRDGIYVRLEGIEERVPLGSMGDGIWRMLGLALAIVHSRNNILLIDDIDTGLHYEVMGKMWRFLDKCARRFDVQIIATTHSRDCYQSLAEICREEELHSSEVTIQRVDRTRAEAVAYSEAEIIAAADHDIEVR